MSVGNFTQVLQGVDRRIQVMRQFQQLSRGLESRDYNILVSNFSYVSNWSLIQVLVVIMSGIVQVYFVKKLFADPKQGAGKSKTRIWVVLIQIWLWHFTLLPTMNDCIDSTVSTPPLSMNIVFKIFLGCILVLTEKIKRIDISLTPGTNFSNNWIWSFFCYFLSER